MLSSLASAILQTRSYICSQISVDEKLVNINSVSLGVGKLLYLNEKGACSV